MEERDALARRPEFQGVGGDLRRKFPGFFLEVAVLSELVEDAGGYPAETDHEYRRRVGSSEMLDAIMEDVKTLIQIDPDMRR